MTVNQFLIDFFKDNDVVRVEAVKLQKMINKIDELEKENKNLKRENELLRVKIEAKKLYIDELKFNEPPLVDIVI